MRATVRPAMAWLAFGLLVLVGSSAAAGPAAAGVDTTVKVTVTLAGNGNGNFRTDDGFINCVRAGSITSGTCSHTYDIPGDPIPYGYVYSSELDSCYVVGDSCITGGTGPSGYLTPGPDQFVTVTFRLLDPTLVTVKKSGTGSGTVKSTPRGINCGSDCKSEYANASSLTIKATAKSGSRFTKWSGGPCDHQGSTCTFTVSASPSTVTAVFTKNVVATPVPVVTEPPAPTDAPVVTSGPTPVVPTPFPTIATPAPTTAGPAPSGAPPASPAADSGRSTLILALSSVLVILLAAGGLYAMRSRRASTPGRAPPTSPPTA